MAQLRAHVYNRFPPEGTKAHTPNHIEKRVKYDQTQQQIEEHGLWEWYRRGDIILIYTFSA